MLHPINTCSNNNNFTFFSSKLSIFLRETRSVSQLPTSLKLVPEGENYFLDCNTWLRRFSPSSFELTNNRFALQGEIHIPSRCPPRIHADRRVQVHDGCTSGKNRTRIHTTRRKSLACGKVMLHHGIQRAGPLLYRSPIVPCACYGPSCSSYSLVYTAKVTDHHGSDFSSLPLSIVDPERFSSGQSTSWNLHTSEHIDVFIVGLNPIN